MAERPGPQSRGFERWLALACAVILLVPLVAEARLGPEDFRLPRPFVAGDDIRSALGRQGHQRMVSIFVGLAAREIAGGQLEALVAPPELNDIADRRPDIFQDEERPAFNETLMRQSSGATIERAEYEIVLTAEQLALLDSRFERIEFPSDVVAFVADNPVSRVSVHTDEERHVVYLVPESAVEGVRE